MSAQRVFAGPPKGRAKSPGSCPLGKLCRRLDIMEIQALTPEGFGAPPRQDGRSDAELGMGHSRCVLPVITRRPQHSTTLVFVISTFARYDARDNSTTNCHDADRAWRLSIADQASTMPPATRWEV